MDNNHAQHDIHPNFLSGIKTMRTDSILALSLQSIVVLKSRVALKPVVVDVLLFLNKNNM